MNRLVKMLSKYVIGCLGRGLQGSLTSALNWASIIGIAAVGTYLDFRGAPMSNPQHRNISFATMTEHLASRSRLACERWASGTGRRHTARPGRTDMLSGCSGRSG